MKFEEQVIVTDVHKNLAPFTNETRVYVKGTSSSFHFLIAKKEKMVKEL